MAYMGQTGRCLNMRLLEYRQRTEKGKDGFMAQHCSECGCTPNLAHSAIIAETSNEQKRLIVEAPAIQEKKGSQ